MLKRISGIGALPFAIKLSIVTSESTDPVSDSDESESSSEGAD